MASEAVVQVTIDNNSNNDGGVKPPQPQYRINYNTARRELRKELAEQAALQGIPETEKHMEARLAYNNKKRKKYQSLPLEKRRKTYLYLFR